MPNILPLFIIPTLIVFIIISLEAFLIISIFSPIERNIVSFIDSTSLTCTEIYADYTNCIVKEVADFVDSRLDSSWNNPMSSLEIDNMLTSTDYYFINMLGFTRAHVILWQGWGSCGQHAILTAYLLNRLGYTTRKANFNDIDHTWAEIYVNGTWYIVDPWYIGLVYERQYHRNKDLVPTNILATLENFKGSHQVTCTYFNGTTIDCTNEHGY